MAGAVFFYGGVYGAVERRGQQKPSLQHIVPDPDWWEKVYHDSVMSSEKKRSAKTGKCSNSNGRDITQLVDTYHHLLDKLYPAFAVWDAVLYVTRYV